MTLRSQCYERAPLIRYLMLPLGLTLPHRPPLATAMKYLLSDVGLLYLSENEKLAHREKEKRKKANDSSSRRSMREEVARRLKVRRIRGSHPLCQRTYIYPPLSHGY